MQITGQFVLEDYCHKEGRPRDQQSHGDRHFERRVNVSGLEFPRCCATNAGTNRTAAGPNPREPAVATILVTPIRRK